MGWPAVVYISTFFSPIRRNCPATQSAALRMSEAWSGRVLMLGMRARSFNSARFSARCALAYSIAFIRVLSGEDGQNLIFREFEYSLFAVPRVEVHTDKPLFVG